MNLSFFTIDSFNLASDKMKFLHVDMEAYIFFCDIRKSKCWHGCIFFVYSIFMDMEASISLSEIDVL
jgi:hypothetical protein